MMIFWDQILYDDILRPQDFIRIGKMFLLCSFFANDRFLFNFLYVLFYDLYNYQEGTEEPIVRLFYSFSSGLVLLRFSIPRHTNLFRFVQFWFFLTICFFFSRVSTVFAESAQFVLSGNCSISQSNINRLKIEEQSKIKTDKPIKNSFHMFENEII